MSWQLPTAFSGPHSPDLAHQEYVRTVHPRLSQLSFNNLLVLLDAIRFHSVGNKKLTFPRQLRREGKFCFAIGDKDVTGADGSLNLQPDPVSGIYLRCLLNVRKRSVGKDI